MDLFKALYARPTLGQAAVEFMAEYERHHGEIEWERFVDAARQTNAIREKHLNRGV